MTFNKRFVSEVILRDAMRRSGLLAAYLSIALIALFGNPKLVLSGDYEELQKLEDQLEALNKAARYPEAEIVARKIVSIGKRMFANKPASFAVCVGNLAKTLDNQGKYKESIPLHEYRLKLLEQSLDAQHPRIANALNDLATSRLAFGDYEESEKLYRRSLSIREKVLGPQDPQLAYDLIGLGRISLDLGRYSEAEPMFQRALTIQEKAFGERGLEVVHSLTHLAMLYRDQDRSREAEYFARRALEINEKSLGADHPDTAETALTLGTISMHQGRYAAAESLFRRTLSIREKVYGKNDRIQTIPLTNLASLFVEQGRLSEAEPLRKKCIEIAVETFGEQHPSVADYRQALASLYLIEERYAEAEALLKKILEVKEPVFGQESPELLEALNLLGSLQLETGHPAEAEVSQKRALKIAETTFGPKHHRVASCLDKLARVYNAQDRHADAEESMDRAIAIDDQSGVGPDKRYHHYLARSVIFWNTDRRNEALLDLRQSLDLAEQARSLTSGGDVERAESFSEFATAFEQTVTFQSVLGDASEALHTIERSRARSLMDEINRVGVDLSFELSPTERKAAKEKVNQLKSRVAQFEKQLNLAPQSEKEKLKVALIQARKDLYGHYRDEQNNSPTLRRLLATSGPPRISQLQRTVLSNDGLGLVYLFGKSAGYVVVADSQRTRIVSLNIDKANAKLFGTSPGPLTASRLREILIGNDNSGVVAQLASPPSGINPEHQKHLIDRLSALWPLLIPESEREGLKVGKYKRMIVVPDGPLSLFPFETLVIQGEQDPEYLLDQGPSILYAPSLSVLFHISSRASVAPKKGETVLTVADPVYARESQVASVQSSVLTELSSQTRYAGLGGHLNRLPFTAEESAVVKEVFSKVGLVASALLRDQATEANVRRNVPARKIVHLACHGLTDQAHGNFFGALALTPGQKANIDFEDDGFLTLPEIYQLDMKGCELAILSACETNYGPQQHGEGVWALSRGFLVSGAKRVVASNWLVNDEAGARLIQYYCTALADDEQQSRPADYAGQLRAAKKWVRNQPNWKHPYFWSTFVLVGPQ